MGAGPAEGGAVGDRLIPLPAPYLLIYDAESPGCRRLIDWIQQRDQTGLVVSFPYQNPQLLHVAPELAGMALAGEVHGFDTRSRKVHRGARLLPSLFRRLPGWGWLALPASLPVVGGFVYRLLCRHPRRFGIRS
jgi:predicted DCC family thiol-disulfide oxidoreductase YuxK